MVVARFHHVAYRCKDAKETVAFYRKVLGMGALAGDSRRIACLRPRCPIPTCTSFSMPAGALIVRVVCGVISFEHPASLQSCYFFAACARRGNCSAFASGKPAMSFACAMILAASCRN